MLAGFVVTVAVVAWGSIAEEPGEIATRLMDLCGKGQFEQAVQPFSEEVLKALPAEKLKQVWGQVTGSLGPLKSLGAPRPQAKIQGYTPVLVRCVFEKGELDALVSVSQEGKVGGFFLRPPQEDPKTDARPAYVKPDLFEELAIEVGAAGWPLKGTLTLPKEGRPCSLVVLVHGSGPNDQDETIGPNKPFKDLAHGLASKGIAVLRYEKRTRAHAAKLKDAKPGEMTLDIEVIDDAISALKFGREQSTIDPKRVFLLGHSLGGSVAPEIARRDGKLAGAILLAAASRPPDQIVLDQLLYLSKNDPGQAEATAKMRAELEPQFAQLREGKLQPDAKVMGAPVAYWNSWLALDPAKVAALIQGTPLFITRGGRDYQVVDADAARFRDALKARPNVTFHDYPSLNHLFISGEGVSVPAEYMKRGFVDEQVIDDLAKWIRATAAGS